MVEKLPVSLTAHVHRKEAKEATKKGRTKAPKERERERERERWGHVSHDWTHTTGHVACLFFYVLKFAIYFHHEGLVGVP